MNRRSLLALALLGPLLPAPVPRVLVPRLRFRSVRVVGFDHADRVMRLSIEFEVQTFEVKMLESKKIGDFKFEGE